MDMLATLRSFGLVAQTGSFTRASHLAGVSQPTLSRQIRELEQHFGVRLFRRTTRALTITEDGRTLLAHARQMLDTLEDAETALGRHKGAARGLVRLGLPTALGLHLAARVQDLLGRHPALSIEFVMRDAFGDMTAEGLDLAVRLGLPSEETLIVRHLWDIERVLVASPAYLCRAAPPASPADLANHACIAYTYGRSRPDWTFSSQRQTATVPAGGQFRANNSEAVHVAALAGSGIALLPIYQVRADLLAGRLRRLLPGWQAAALSFQATYPAQRSLPQRTRVVLDYIASLPSAEFSATSEGQAGP